MLRDLTIAEDVYVVCGYTDMRKSIDGLAAMINLNFGMDPFAPSLFLFCGKRRDRLKALFWEGDGFVVDSQIQIIETYPVLSNKIM
jgi:transposase